MVMRWRNKGRAGPALAIAAIGSLFAGSVVTLLIAAAGPPLASVALLFQSADYVSVMVLGLVSAVVLANGSVLKAIGMIVLGVLFGTVGTDTQSGAYRMTFGIDVLFDGLGFVPISMGIFGLAEIVYNIEHQDKAATISGKVTGLMPKLADIITCLPAMIRGTDVGTVFGILPGGGRRLRPSPPIRSRRRCPRIPSASAGARSKAWRRRNPPTTRPRRRASFRC